LNKDFTILECHSWEGIQRSVCNYSCYCTCSCIAWLCYCCSCSSWYIRPIIDRCHWNFCS